MILVLEPEVGVVITVIRYTQNNHYFEFSADKRALATFTTRLYRGKRRRELQAFAWIASGGWSELDGIHVDSDQGSVQITRRLPTPTASLTHPVDY